jgi:hypothetical protein
MKVLIWNIQFFALNKIDDPTKAPVGQENKKRQREFILSTVLAADPDVFVVLEPRCGQGQIGGVAEGQGPQALVLLHGFLAAQNPNWLLVPPLRVNDPVSDQATYTEAVGVFWRKDKVTFNGPLSLAPQSYPEPWDKLSDHSQYLAEVPQSETDSAEARRIGGVSYRQPYITDFAEGARRVRLVSVHLPPKNSKNRGAINQLARIAKVDVVGNGNPDVILIAGDLNLNIGTRGDVAQRSLVNGIRCLDLGVNYPEGKFLIPYPRTPQAAPDTDASSTLKPVSKAKLGDYTGRNLYDYGLAYYKGNPHPPGPTYSAVAADPVQGVGAVAGAGNPLKAFPSALLEIPVTEANFGADQNYKHVRDTSDHMPVLMEV